MLIYRVIFLSLLIIIPLYLPPTTVISDDGGVTLDNSRKPLKTIQNKPQKAFETMAVVPVSALDYIHIEATKYGWGSGYQWQALKTLLNGESGINPYAINATSGACGIFQAWPCSKLGVPLSDVAGQARWGMKYIQDVYGTPSVALSKWQARSPHWY